MDILGFMQTIFASAKENDLRNLGRYRINIHDLKVNAARGDVDDKYKSERDGKSTKYILAKHLPRAVCKRSAERFKKNRRAA